MWFNKEEGIPSYIYPQMPRPQPFMLTATSYMNEEGRKNNAHAKVACQRTSQSTVKQQITLPNSVTDTPHLISNIHWCFEQKILPGSSTE